MEQITNIQTANAIVNEVIANNNQVPVEGTQFGAWEKTEGMSNGTYVQNHMGMWVEVTPPSCDCNFSY